MKKRTLNDYGLKERTMTKKGIIISASALALYTVVVILCFMLIPRAADNENKNTNTFEERSYSYIDYTDAEKAELLGNIDIDLHKLASGGFQLTSEKYMMPTSWKKELHVIVLSFENIYCTVTINVHEDEIGWERNGESLYTSVSYLPIEIDGRAFDRNGDILRYDDTDRGVLFLFECSLEPDDTLYKDFLRLFLELEVA